MKAALGKNPVRATLLTAVLTGGLALAGCEFETAGGNGAETTNHIAGIVERSDGTTAARAIVTAVPAGFNPIKDTLAPGLIDTADEQGRFRIYNPVGGTYHLQIVDRAYGDRARKTGIEYTRGNTDAGRIRLRKSGSLSIAFPPGLKNGGGVVYVPGSTYRVDVGESSRTLLDSLPETRLPIVAFSRNPGDPPIIIARDIDIRSGDTTLLSVADTNTLPYEAKFAIKTTSAGAGVPEDVADIPILLRLDSSNFDFRISPADRADLAFYGNENMPLPYEIERWDSLGRKAEIWLRMGMIKGNSETQYILMRWGPAGKAQCRCAPVFDTSLGYVGVYHLGIGDSDRRNSADTAEKAWTLGFDGDERIEGLIGPADTLEKGRDTAGNFINDIIWLGHLPIEKDFTLSAWVRFTEWPIGDYVVGRNPGTAGKGDAFFQLELGSDSTLPYVRVSDGNRVYGTEEEGAIPTGTNPIALGAWNLVQGTFDGSELRTYVNGVLVSARAAPVTGSLNSGNELSYIGFAYGGAADEVRVEKTARSAAWNKLSYENQKPGQSLVKRVR